MTTLTGEEHSQILHSEQDLQSYFDQYAKPAECMRVGLEAEFFGVFKSTGQALPYDGPSGIQAVLQALAKQFQYEPIYDGKRVIGLKRGSNFIALEPGGQLELSAEPVKSIFETEEQIIHFIKELRQVSRTLGDFAWLAVGIHPFSGLEDITWVPKHRYQIMADYLKDRGSMAHDMMKRTCSIQVNFDYQSESDAMDKLRTALAVSSIVTAMFANSSFSKGRPNGFLCKRLDIWNHTDPGRSGLITEFLKPGKKFSDYLEYLLDMPLIFIVRNHDWLPVGNLKFRQFIKKGFQGFRATVGDFELHLSTAFPEARLKQYLEVRGVDCQAPLLIPSVAALWKGIFYDAEARAKVWDLIAFASENDHRNLNADVPRKGLQAKLGSKPILPIARELVEISCWSLSRQIPEDENRNECVYLQRIREHITKPGKSPAVVLLEKWNGEFEQKPQQLIEYLDIIRG